MNFQSLFPKSKPVIGVIHLQALPGAPLYDGQLEKVYEQALNEAAIFNRHVDGIIVENFNDHPFYPKQVPAETIAAMSIICREVVKQVNVPVGVNVLRNDAYAAMAIATAAMAHFIRVNVHSNAVVADQGIIQGRAFETLRLRSTLKSKVLVFADVGVKHAKALADRGLAIDTKDMTRRGMVDALVVSGTGTGAATSTTDLDLVQANTHLPVLIGSGTRPDTLAEIKQADGFIVGSYFKKDGKAMNEVEEGRVAELKKHVLRLV